MCPAWGPLHLVAFAEALAEHLIDHGFHKARADLFAMVVTLAIGRNKSRIVVDVG
jgi:hypothetical protein